MTVKRLIELTGYTPLVLSDPEREIDGGYVGDLLSWVMGRARAGSAWVTIMSNLNVVAVASLADVACVIFAEGVIPDESAVSAARERGVNLICSPASSFNTVLAVGELAK